MGEFDIESTSVAEVGSLIDTISDSSSFGALPTRMKNLKLRKGKEACKRPLDEIKGAESREGKALDQIQAEPKTKAKASRTKKTDADSEAFEDAEASVREASAVAEMTVRRGGRDDAGARKSMRDPRNKWKR
jgi:hypothetical protein